LYQQFAITIAISVIISAFIALSLTPALCTLLLKPTDESKKNKGLTKWFTKFNNWFDRVTAKYTNGVRRSIKGAKYIVILLLCVCVGAYFLFQSKPTGFIPSEDDGNLYVTFQLPPATSTAQSVNIMSKLMKVVASTPGVGHYAALSGLNVVTNATNSNNGTIYVQLKPWDERSGADEQVPGIINVMQKRIRDAGVTNANVEVIQPSPLPGVWLNCRFQYADRAAKHQ
jgi:HAE1 family hydrophobic/amphiphilic exporter-1